MGTIKGSVFRDAFAANFNGTDEYAYVDDPSFEGNTAGAFCIRFRPVTLLGVNGTKGIIGFGNRSGANDARISFSQRRVAATGTANRISTGCVPTNGGTASIISGSTNLAATTQYSVVIQSSGSAWTIYVNGSNETLTLISGSNTGDWLGDISGTDHRLVFGNSFFSNNPQAYNDCRLNECIYVSGRALTGGEITEWHNGGVTRNANRLSFRSDIQSWWRFGDSRDDATTIYDEIGSNNLTLVNMDASNYVAP